MQFGQQILDGFMAPRLSELRACSAPEVPELPHYRGSLILNHVFCGLGYPDHLRVPISMFITRLREATAEYRDGRAALLEYVGKLPDHAGLAAHGRAVSQFESCLVRLDLAATALSVVAKALGAAALHGKNDGSVLDRLHRMVNRMKHFDEDIVEAASRSLPIPLAPIWLTNEGVECERCGVSYSEIAFTLTDFAEDAQNLSEVFPRKAAERRGDAVRVSHSQPTTHEDTEASAGNSTGSLTIRLP